MDCRAVTVITRLPKMNTPMPNRAVHVMTRMKVMRKCPNWLTRSTSNVADVTRLLRPARFSLQKIAIGATSDKPRYVRATVVIAVPCTLRASQKRLSYAKKIVLWFSHSPI
jgi:hypothetical protein